MTTGPSPSGAMKTYSYDARNRLTSFDGSGYTYNPEGLRTAVTGTGAATFLVDPNAALSRVLRRTKGGVTTYYVYGHGLLYQESGGVTRTYHGNQVGSTLVLTDDSQNVTDRIGYAPYGTITERTGSTDTPFLFNGEYGVMTDTNGLICMRARYYNPRLMRFVNADPIKFDGGANWYAFCGNSPLSLVDPWGLQDSRSDVFKMDTFYVYADPIKALEKLKPSQFENYLTARQTAGNLSHTMGGYYRREIIFWVYPVVGTTRWTYQAILGSDREGESGKSPARRARLVHNHISLPGSIFRRPTGDILPSKDDIVASYQREFAWDTLVFPNGDMFDYHAATYTGPALFPFFTMINWRDSFRMVPAGKAVAVPALPPPEND
ncbi:RHS repeat-associated core domain-containing protein [Opitutus sp. ER46]|uniref:RHS repeat-associated core domain-containing protein n=1 Tax=Opitutus sp. ER46 TaxID=2161864 RepID=UPI000D300215|nr:RHS repeat-associated core domain-containing protein [Opitutus sp. ER46]PTY01287.1 hypothetical protein DB354_00055 [Opitutus sp. ER46]